MIFRYVDTWDYIVLAFEFVYYIFVGYYIVEEVLEIIKVGWGYFSGFWNNLDIVVLVLCVLNISLNLYTTFVVSSQLETLLKVSISRVYILSQNFLIALKRHKHVMKIFLIPPIFCCEQLNILKFACFAPFFNLKKIRHIFI